MSLRAKPKFLCLHGWRTSGAIMRWQLEQAVNGFCQDWELVLPDAPHQSSGPPQAVIDKLFPNQPYFEWYDTQTTTDGKKFYAGLDETIAYVQNIILNEGPFEAIVGFSQGAILTTLLTGMMRSDPTFLPPNYRWSYVVPIAGMPVREDAKQALFMKPLDIPALVVYGEKDEYLKYCQQLVAVYDESKRDVLTHPGGHIIPKDLGALGKRMKSYNRHWWALDFDGVLCDSAVETGISGWKSAEGLIKGASSKTLPPTDLQEEFRKVRPVLETGYQAILLMYLLANGSSVEKILANPVELMNDAKAQLNVSVEDLKDRFHLGRNKWIEENEEEWLNAHGFFQQAVEASKLLVEEGQQVYIITTKHSDFAQKLLKKCGLKIPNENVFGLGSGKKLEVMKMLSTQPPNVGATPVFLEDRLKTLLSVREGDLTCRYALASWGYNTESDKASSAAFNVPLITEQSWYNFVTETLEHRSS